tara:strand:+ start:193 stop:765 length:573 start_codon:yes stop_codon:yes gene_type:complete
MLKLNHDSLLPEQISSYKGDLILTTLSEAPKSTKISALYEDILNFEPTVIRGLIMQKVTLTHYSDELLIGIDPGKRIGLSIYYYGKEIERSFNTSVDDLVSYLVRILAGLRAKRKLVKIGNGDMKLAKKITNLLNLKFCSDFQIEFVDERKTSVKIKNYNQRGKRDMLSAKFITRRDGPRHLVLPLSRTG